MEIANKKQLRQIIAEDCRIYHDQPMSKLLIKKIIGHSDAIFCKFLEHMRKEQYYKYRRGGVSKLLYLFSMSRKNKYGMMLGIELHGECVGRGVTIRHYGCITVNAFAQIGDYCTFRGDNCVGVARDGGIPPKIGNNVDIGFGAKIIGDLQIADNCIIGANAVVTRSCLEEGAVLAGVPARIIKHGVYNGKDKDFDHHNNL